MDGAKCVAVVLVRSGHCWPTCSLEQTRLMIGREVTHGNDRPAADRFSRFFRARFHPPSPTPFLLIPLIFPRRALLISPPVTASISEIGRYNRLHAAMSVILLILLRKILQNIFDKSIYKSTCPICVCVCVYYIPYIHKFRFIHLTFFNYTKYRDKPVHRQRSSAEKCST